MGSSPETFESIVRRAAEGTDELKYRVYFGEPMSFTGDPDDDDAVIEEKVWVVRATVQSMFSPTPIRTP